MSKGTKVVLIVILIVLTLLLILPDILCGILVDQWSQFTGQEYTGSDADDYTTIFGFVLVKNKYKIDVVFSLYLLDLISILMAQVAFIGSVIYIAKK